MKTPISKENIKRHMTYNWWKYLLTGILIVFGLDLFFTVSVYKSPEDKKVELYVYGYMNDEGIQTYLDQVHQTVLSDMEEVTAQCLISDETYGDMVLQVRMMAHEGDIYILPKETFVNYCRVGYFAPLENDEEIQAILEDKQINVQSGWRSIHDDDTNQDEKPHLYGIPITQLYSLYQYVYVEDGYLCVSVVNGNEENTMKLFHTLLKDMSEPVQQTEATQEKTTDQQ